MREALALICLGAVGVGVVTVVALRAREQNRTVQCASQVRDTVGALHNWASNGQGHYPLPSTMDIANNTVPELGEAKNTSANIFSVLVGFGGVKPDMLVCPSERNPWIRADTDYRESSPPSAVNPVQAVWDPAFRADFTAGHANLSYAHLQPAGRRRSMWSDTYSATEAIIADRGPHVAGVRVAGSGTLPEQYSVDVANSASNTFRTHGSPKAWQGNIAFNDGHVEFAESLGPQRDEKSNWPAFSLRANQTRLDTLFFDETEGEKSSFNLFLGIFPVAGPTPNDYRAIWD